MCGGRVAEETKERESRATRTLEGSRGQGRRGCATSRGRQSRGGGSAEREEVGDEERGEVGDEER